MKAAAAEILASSLSTDQARAFRVVAGKDKHASEIPSEALVVLCELGLVRRDQDGERELVLLTQRGRKVARFL